ncbi:MAG TPA: hypothetical protein VLG69_01585 [Candidatus Andersenbacteria bacterium]|nr:hypothetical protein [Candidatus Andersenbacteria bacterium]
MKDMKKAPNHEGSIMNFENLDKAILRAREMDWNKVLRLTISDVRIEIAKNSINFLRSDSDELREPSSVGRLQNYQNYTKATYVAKQLAFFLTQYYTYGNDREEKTWHFTEEGVSDLLAQCGTNVLEIIELLKKASSIETEELLKIGALGCAIARLAGAEEGG